MQDDRLEAIVKFATDEDYGLISEAELREHAPSWHAAQRLLEYLKQDFDTERILPPSTLEGTYRNGRIDEDSFVVRELTLQRASDDGLIQLVQIEDSYDLLDGMQFDDFTPEKREEVRDSRIVYGGWAILTPEDNLLMFLKKERTGHNCYYLTVAAENWHSLQAPAAALALLRHDYPIETNEGEPLEPKQIAGDQRGDRKQHHPLQEGRVAMPTFLERQTATPEGLAMAVTELRARIEERRKAAWQPEPGETVQERRMHWELCRRATRDEDRRGRIHRGRVAAEASRRQGHEPTRPGIPQGCRARQRACRWRLY